MSAGDPSKPAPLKLFLVRWGVSTVAVFVATLVVPGIECESWTGLVVATLVLGLLNTFVRPLLFVLSLPLVVFSLGLFLWVINAALLYFVGWLVKPFEVGSFPSALGGAAVIGLISLALESLFGVKPLTSHRRVRIRTDRRTGGREGSGGPPGIGGGGPVIDV